MPKRQTRISEGKNVYHNKTKKDKKPLGIEKIKTLTKNIDIPIGVHMHNNKGLAYANTIQAYDSGAEYLDGTITGIGRGSGNAQTEYLSCFLKNISLDFHQKFSASNTKEQNMD